VKSKTVVISLVVHLGLAFALFGATNHRVAARRQATAVRLADEKKKPPPPKPTPKPVVKPAPRKVASIPKEEPAAAKATAPAPRTTAVATAIKMTSEDAVASAGDIVVPVSGRALATVGPPPSRRPRIGEGAEEGPCHEEPSKPEPVFKTEIEYTARAKADGIEGKLKLKLVVGRDGSVVSVEVLAGVSPELDAAAVEAAKKWRFRPAMACGRPVAGGSYVLARKFELGD
jgi:protein TonB